MEKSKPSSLRNESTSGRTGNLVRDRMTTFEQETTTQVASNQSYVGLASHRSGSTFTNSSSVGNGVFTNGSVQNVDITNNINYSSLNRFNSKIVDNIGITNSIDYSSHSVELIRQSEWNAFKTLNSHLSIYIEFLRSKVVFSKETTIKIIEIIKEALSKVKVDFGSVYGSIIKELERKIEWLKVSYSEWEIKINESQRRLDRIKETDDSEINIFIKSKITIIKETICEEVRMDYEAKLIQEIIKLRIEFLEYCFKNNIRINSSGVEIDIYRFFKLVYKQRYEISRKKQTKFELVEEIIYLKKVYKALIEQIKYLRISAIEFEQTDIFIKQNIDLIKQESLRMFFQKYSYLLDINETFDSELISNLKYTSYKQLIDSEIARLQLHYTIDKNDQCIISVDNQEKDAVIDDINLQGDYIRLKNNGVKKSFVGSWTVKAIAEKPTGDGEDIRIFKLQANQEIMPGKTITIWSPSRGGVHNPPESYVMKGVVWPASNKIRVELRDQNDKEKTHRETYSDVKVLKKSTHIL